MEIHKLSVTGEAGNVADEARVKRRKAAFRRRVARLLIGLVLILGIFLWQRNRSVILSCESSLTEYGKASMAVHLETEPMELIESSWLTLKVDSIFGAGHYHVLAVNWGRRPGEGEDVPLAMCAEPHLSMSGQGRNVLFRTATGLETRWVDEATAQIMLAPALATVHTGSL